MLKYLLVFPFCCLIAACSGDSSNGDSNSEKLQPVDIKNIVEIEILNETTFHKEIISNGKVKARRKSNLNFDISGELKEIKVRNGDLLTENSVIAIIDQDKIQRSLDQARLQLDKAELELRDILIGQRYRLEDSAGIPENIFKIAKLRSGYSAALQDLRNAENDLRNTVLRAPFQGVVANIQFQEHEQISPADEFCTLIDYSSFEVEFPILETEIHEISLGKTVIVTSFTNESDLYKGYITEINPVVDENGQLQVKARVENSNGLMDGMNVKLKIESNIPGQLVVPKSSILMRQDQQVLFKFTRGTAYWTYVQTEFENSTSYTVKPNTEKAATLRAGDTIIISGNLNLAHGSEVVVGE